MVEGALRYCVVVQEQLMLGCGLTHAAGIINHAAQVGLSTLVTVQVRRAACCDQFCMFHCVMCCLGRNQTQRNWISTLVCTAVNESSLSRILTEKSEWANGPSTNRWSGIPHCP